MALTVDAVLSPANFVPWSQRRTSPQVGSFSVDLGATGDATGNPVIVNSEWTSGEWGFRAILVPKGVSIQANADPGNVRVEFTAAGNRRLLGNVTVGFDPIQVGSDFVTPEYVFPADLSIDLGQVVETALRWMQVEFAANTDGTAYHAHAWGLVYDAEMLARV